MSCIRCRSDAAKGILCVPIAAFDLHEHLCYFDVLETNQVASSCRTTRVISSIKSPALTYHHFKKCDYNSIEPEPIFNNEVVDEYS